MARIYKFVIIAFVVGGLVLVSVFLYQDYTFKNHLSKMNTSKQNFETVNTLEEIDDEEEDTEVITISNTDELSIGTFDTVETQAIIIYRDSVRVSFPVDSINIILSCTDQELYQVEKWDPSKVTRNRRITLDQLPSFVKTREPVIVTSLVDKDGVQKAYGVVVKSNTVCKS